MKLYPHQQKVLEETERFHSVGYFLDMGLGKTFVGSEKMKDLNADVNLIICQKSKIKDWMNHFIQNYSLKPYDLTDKTQLNEFMIQTDKKIGIINYELAWRRKQLLKLSEFTLTLDESSLIQNPKAKQTKFILKLKPANVILLSGTPSSGKYENLWSQCHLLGWELSEKTFQRQYVNWKKLELSDGSAIFTVDKANPYKNTERMKRKMKEHGCIFMKTEEAFKLPEQIFIPVKVYPSKDYKIFEKSKVLELPEETLVGDTELSFRLGKRKLCGMYSEAKLEAFRDLISSTADNLVVFYNFTNEMLKLKQICYEQGKTVGIINGMQKDDPEGTDILLIQYQAGAYGLNLQHYSNKIIYFTVPDKSELWEQSQKRIHRIGQDKTCFYYMMIVRNSMETKEIIPTLKMRKEWNDELFRD